MRISLKLFLDIVINGSLIPERSAHFNGYLSANVMGHCNGITMPLVRCHKVGTLNQFSLAENSSREEGDPRSCEKAS